MEGVIRTIFQGDPDGLLAAHSRIKTAQKESEEGNHRIAKSAKQMGYDYDAALGNVNRGLIELNQRQKDAFMGMEQGAARAAAGIRQQFKSAFADINAMMGARHEPYWESRDAGALRARMRSATHDNMGVIDRIGAQGGLSKDVLRDLDDIYVKQQRISKETKEGGGLTSQWARSAMGVASAYVGIQEAIGWAKSAMQDQDRVAEESLSKLQTLAKAQATVFFNMGLDKNALAKASPQIADMAVKYGVAQPDQVFNTYSAAMSRFKGDAGLAMDATEQATRLTRHNPETGEQALGALANIRLADPTISMEEASALFVSAGKVAPQVKDKFVAEYVTPLAVSGANYSREGLSRRGAIESMAVGITLGEFKGDQYGRMSLTNANLIHESTRNYFKAHPELADPGTPGARLRIISQQSMDQRQAFADSLGGDAAMAPVKEMIALGRENVWGVYDKAMQEMTLDPQQLKDLDSGMEKGTPAMEAAATSGRTEARAYRNAQLPSGQLAAKFQQMRNEYKVVEDMAASEGGWGNSWAGRRVRYADILAGRAMGNKDYAGSLRNQAQGMAENLPTAAGRAAAMESVNTLAKLEREIAKLTDAINKNSDATDKNTSGAGGGVGGLGGDQKRRAGRP